MTNGQIFLFIRTPRAISPATVNNNIKSSVSARDGHGLGPSMGWVELDEKYCGIIAEYCKTHTFHCP